ncbi:response regulator transcription factor [Bermanella marisrubri]|uniref:Regulatory protein CsgD n=1 Tax=Bermanella marisrubri TaxID=207949 RepID=Q1N2F1_9GAMM|nr:response regulator transcription factor [Bermanella marisrubri]EAT12456.1 regulatory protein CsgD [Oceanobacter sp. RED65] [Bermanella marisrubri]QIZ85534.1 response regulator transcription factor [Bermanella marisrubri]
MDSAQKPHLWLVGPKNIQNSLLLGFLQQHLQMDCSMLENYRPADNHKIKLPHLICVDAMGMRAENCRQMLESLPKDNQVVFINLDGQQSYDELLKWPNVSGFFYKGASQNHVSKGIRSILRGELWFSRRILSQFMANNRRPPAPEQKPAHNLTRRESQILSLSASGAKNADIAAALNVSTHTVKTHMYNLFKKLDVSNRIQAVNWAKEYLPEQDLS